MLSPGDPKTLALILFRAFSLQARDSFLRYLSNPPPPKIKESQRAFRFDVDMTVAAIGFFGRHLDQFFSAAGDLDRLAMADELQGEVCKFTPTVKIEDIYRGFWREEEYLPAIVGRWWLEQALLALECILDYCGEEKRTGTVGMIYHYLGFGRDMLDCHLPSSKPESLDEFVCTWTGMHSLLVDDDDAAQDKQQPATAAAPPEPAPAPPESAQQPIRFREFL